MRLIFSNVESEYKLFAEYLYSSYFIFCSQNSYGTNFLYKLIVWKASKKRNGKNE